MSTTETAAVELDYSDYVERLREQHCGLADEFVDLTGVEGVLQWTQQRGLGRTAIDLVGQDEFSYDFLLDLQRDGQWLAFGVT